MRKFFAAAFLALALLPAKAHAWGEEGHKIVCGIAWQRLTPEAHGMVAKLLGTDDEKTFVEACVWADQIRQQRPEASSWHYVNIPAGVAGMDMARDCGDVAKRCAPWAIVNFTKVLVDPSKSAAERADALKFISHFIGDLHQPLHAGRPEDLGGNRVTVDFFGYTGQADRPLNLHSVWDSQLLRRANQTWPSASQALNGQIAADEALLWQTANTLQWADESYKICEEFVYGHLPQDHKLRNEYYLPGLGYADVQLQKAGVRLAFVLNAAANGRAVFAS